MIKLESNRLLLRPLDKKDAEQALAVRLRNRSFLQPFEPMRDEHFFTLEGQREIIAKEAADREAGTAVSFGVFLRQGDGTEGELIGRMAISVIVRGTWQNANVGYFIAERYNGVGYAAEALRLVVGFAFGELRLHRVQAAVMTHNQRSERVLLKAGFRREGLALRYLRINGRWEDHMLFAITAEELA